jgi:hypothetical protein
VTVVGLGLELVRLEDTQVAKYHRALHDGVVLGVLEARDDVDAVIDNSYVLKFVIARMKLQDKLVSGGPGSHHFQHIVSPLREATTVKEIAEHAGVETDRVEKVLAMIQQMDPMYREIIIMRFFEGMKVGDIAQRLNIPLNTVKTRLRRAVDWLRDYLRKNETF